MVRIFTRIYLSLVLFCLPSLYMYGQSVGGTVSGATAVCPNQVNSGFLMLNGHTGTILYWEASTDGGLNWTNIGNPISSYSYTNLTQSTCYRVIVQAPTFPADTSTVACITIIPPSVGGTVSGGGVFCATAPGNTLQLSGYVGSIVNWQYSTNGGVSWTIVPDTNNTLIHPAITQNTLYQAVVQNGVGCPKDTSANAMFVIHPLSNAGSISGAAVVCYVTELTPVHLPRPEYQELFPDGSPLPMAVVPGHRS
jgi:hypothetical protein